MGRRGRRYIEGLAGLWCAGLGFSEKRLVEAARRQLDKMPYTHTFAHRSSEPVVELAERLVKLAPKPIAKAFFVNSGSEAIDTAIKLVWYYSNARGLPEKKRIIARPAPTTASRSRPATSPACPTPAPASTCR